MDNLIYDFKSHSLYYEKPSISVPIFSLLIDTLEMVFELQTGKLIGIQGFFPIIKAITCSISLPMCDKKEYVLKNSDLSSYEQNKVYDMLQRMPQIKKYFEKMQIKYDKERGIIQVGSDMQKGEIGIKINNNILCGFDNNLDLKCLYIIPTIFIGVKSEKA